MTQAVTLFGKMLTFSRLKLQTDDLQLIRRELQQVLTDNPIASGLPIVIDSGTKPPMRVRPSTSRPWSAGVDAVC